MRRFGVKVEAITLVLKVFEFFLLGLVTFIDAVV